MVSLVIYKVFCYRLFYREYFLLLIMIIKKIVESVEFRALLFALLAPFCAGP